jgi:hypothetical protein
MTASPYSTSRPAPDELIDTVAREIQLRGLTAPALLFLEAGRPGELLGGEAMCFFDRELHRVFTGEVAGVDRVLADPRGLERLIVRLEEIDQPIGWDA